MVSIRGFVPSLQWLLRLFSLLLYINSDALCILLGPLCLSYQYNQYVLLVSLTHSQFVQESFNGTMIMVAYSRYHTIPKSFPLGGSISSRVTGFPKAIRKGIWIH